MKKILIFLFVFTFIVSCATFRPSGRTSEELKEEIQELLKEHPELVLDVLRQNKVTVYKIAQQGAQADHENQRRVRWEAELKNPFKPEINQARPVLGYSKAPIVIVSYSDFLCDYCKIGAETVESLLKKYPKKLRLVFKHHTYSEFSKRISLYFEAIGRQSAIQAWKFHDKVFENQELVDQKKEKALKDIVKSLKINRSKLADDLKSATLAKRLEQDMKEVDAFGFEGTPVFLVNGVAIHGAAPIEDFETVIEMVEKK
jgi:protein-disulfide isomerase